MASDENEQIGVTVSDDIDFGVYDANLEQYGTVENQPLLGEKISVAELKNEYAPDDVIYQEKLVELMKKYKYYRSTRRDGNCFYRAFAFGYLERNMNNRTELQRFRQLTEHCRDQLVQLGYSEYTIEDVRDVVLEIIDNRSEKTLTDGICSQPYSDYFVAYLRLLTSAYLQIHREFFENFIEDGKSVQQFCSSEVEPMARESDNIHIIALTKATVVPLRVIYMDRSEHSSLTIHDFASTDEQINGTFEPMITMLYRPGHYDLLYADGR